MQVSKVILQPPEQQGDHKHNHKCIQIVSVENDQEMMMTREASRAGAKGKDGMSVLFTALPRCQQRFVGSQTLQARTLQTRHLIQGL